MDDQAARVADIGEMAENSFTLLTSFMPAS